MRLVRYLAPEYAQSGQITEKADVYSFGVVLVELVTGRKAVDLNRPKGQQCLTEWVLFLGFLLICKDYPSMFSAFCRRVFNVTINPIPFAFDVLI